MYRVNIDGGKVYLPGRVANFIFGAIEHYLKCEHKEFSYSDDPFYGKMALLILNRSYNDKEKESEGVDFSDGWGFLP